MPIKDKTLYPKDWSAISREVRERDGQKCTVCDVQNGILISRHVTEPAYMTFDGDVFHAETGEEMGCCRGSEWNGKKVIKVVLTVAHLDRTTGNNGEPGNRPNLASMCQLHHLRYDLDQHKESAAKTRRAKDPTGDLFS